MALSEIEKLERRYAENPSGLTFAPLAEVHRKNGDLTRALDLLKPGLELHPDYIPASIVLGRCHLDLGDLPAAEAAFTHVLALDGENVIALKALADISERLLRLDDAERWLHTLLSVDRSNDDARDQLARVEGARRQAETGSAVNPDAAALAGEQETAVAPPDQPGGAEPEPATMDAAQSMEPSAFDSEAAGLESGETVAAAAPAADEKRSDLAWISEPEASTGAMPLTLEELGSQAHEPAAAEGPPADLVVEEMVDLRETVEPLQGLVGRDEDAVGVGAEFRVETNEDIVLRSSGGSEFQMPDASEELFADSGLGEEEPPVAARTAPADSEPERSEVWTPPVAEEPPAFEIASGVPLTGPEPLTEAAEPLAEAEPPAEAEPAAEPVFETPKRSFSARETGGQSVAEFLSALLAARLPATPAARPPRPEPAAPAVEAGGAPTRPAPDTLSLSAVFGEEATPVPPAVPASGAGAPSSGVSYDEFFGSSSPASRPARTPDPKSDDLDQFHAWLQNLKR